MDEIQLEDEPSPTLEESQAIKAIGKDSIHKICSGQVVLTLAVAVKELVENSIDAGATLVEVKLKEHGLEAVEVSDNGSGVEESNLQAMTAKYHTSKIREFIDLRNVETFGFRGEALSSLCALADMTIVTRHQQADVAVKIELDHDGRIKERSKCAGTVGTTVTLRNLFATLPVRKREFVKNIKKEFAKMGQIVQAYGLVSKGVRIICTNHNAKSGKSIFMKTNGSTEILDNITSIFGVRQTTELIPIDCNFIESADNLQIVEDNDSKTSQITTEEINDFLAKRLRIEGYISSCAHGAGRSAKDRQYFFINSRPCDPKNIMKLVNDVYHQFNAQHSPFVYLNVETDRDQVDVNLTPDKRQLMITNERVLLFLIKKSLLKAFANIPSTYKMQTIQLNNTKTTAAEIKAEGDLDEVDDTVPKTSTKRFLVTLSQWRHTGDTKGVAPPLPAVKRKYINEIDARTLQMKKIQKYLTTETTNIREEEINGGQKREETSMEDKADDMKINLNVSKPLQSDIKDETLDDATGVNIKDSIIASSQEPPSLGYGSDDDWPTDSSSCFSSQRTNVELDHYSSGDEGNVYTRSEIRTSIDEIRASLSAEESLLRERKAKIKLKRLKFKTEILPSQNSHAEKELEKEITKEMFAQMDVIGQFNLGFIVVRLDEDLFIIDQHATDEKYNFEMLQRDTILQHQPLALPQTLDMTAVNEMILFDNLQVFERNGFRFEINENAQTTKKIRLLGKPFSKNWDFGKADIDELIFMLQDAPESASLSCRPSRIRAMFASRACRKSVMIGKALNRRTMELLVRHMGEIDQPWNCPHGRPTMRHLINIAMLQDQGE